MKRIVATTVLGITLAASILSNAAPLAVNEDRPVKTGANWNSGQDPKPAAVNWSEHHITRSI